MEKPPTERQDEMNGKKQELFDNTADAAIAYKEAHTTENKATGEYDAARKATEAHAEFSDIGYGRAAQLALEIVNC